jgi:hypothetical protein
MYGYLEFDPDRDLSAFALSWQGLIGKIPPEERDRRKNVLSAILMKECANEPDVMSRVRADMNSVLSEGINMAVEFVVYMSVAHHRLPPEHRAQRTNTIERILSAHFGPKPAHQPLSNTLAFFKPQASLLPDALLETEVRSFCFEIADHLSREERPLPEYDPTAFKAALKSHLKDSKYPQVPDLIEDLSKFVLSRPADSRDAFRQKIITLVDKDAGKSLVETFVRLNTCQELQLIHRYDFYETAIGHLLTAGTADWSLISGDFMVDLLATINAQAIMMVWESASAVLNGIAMGPYTDSSRDALQRSVQAHLGIHGVIKLQRIHNARALAAVDERQLSEQDTLELGMVQAMSVDQLVQWIEGPIAEARPTRRPIDRKAIVQRAQKQQQKDAQSEPSPIPTPTPETPITQQGVDDTIFHTLSANASFWQREIDDLIGMSKSIQLATGLTGPCSSLRGDLVRLTQMPDGFEVEAARDLLLKAEEAVAALRQGINQAKAANREHEYFASKLTEALGKEAKVLGKRFGGQIECPLTLDDWGYVVNNFHKRWLPNVKSVVIDGKSVPLDNDQAAALYVTASSRSGFAFDVSVHLWRRRRRCTGMPGLSHALYAPMNRDEWFDTYQTCCVLHIPLKS